MTIVKRIIDININQMKVLLEHGHTDGFICKFFAIDTETLKNWKKAYPDFKKSFDNWRETANEQVTKALFEKAVGYKEYAEAITPSGKTVKKLKQQHSPDVGAIKHWQVNRDAENWKDIKHTDNKTKVEGDLNLNKDIEVTDRVEQIIKDTINEMIK